MPPKIQKDILDTVVSQGSSLSRKNTRSHDHICILGNNLCTKP